MVILRRILTCRSMPCRCPRTHVCSTRRLPLKIERTSVNLGRSRDCMLRRQGRKIELAIAATRNGAYKSGRWAFFRMLLHVMKALVLTSDGPCGNRICAREAFLGMVYLQGRTIWFHPKIVQASPSIARDPMGSDGRLGEITERETQRALYCDQAECGQYYPAVWAAAFIEAWPARVGLRTAKRRLRRAIIPQFALDRQNLRGAWR